MRKVALLLVIPIIAVILSSCTFVTTRVKDSYIQKEYIDKVKVPEKYKVGTKEIKFYVDKVMDSRKTKHVWRKGWANLPIGAPVEINNFTETIKHATLKALANTGWGVDENNPNYLVCVDIKKLAFENSLFTTWNRAFSTVTICKPNGQIVIKKTLKEETPFAGQIDFTMRFRGIAGQTVRQFYKSLLEFFSSPEFVNAIKEDYYNTHSVKQERAE